MAAFLFLQGGRPQKEGEGGLAKKGRQVTVGHYKEYTYNIPQLVLKCLQGRLAKDAGRQASERGGGRRGKTERQITIKHYKEYTYTYNILQLVLKCLEGWRAKDAGRQASERGVREAWQRQGGRLQLGTIKSTHTTYCN